jgi:hypothetical protein
VISAQVLYWLVSIEIQVKLARKACESLEFSNTRSVA